MSKRKITSIFVFIMILAAYITVNANETKNEHEMLTSFGICDRGEEYDGSAYISIGDFAKYVLRLSNYPDTDENDSLEAAFSLGILPSQADGNIYKNKLTDYRTASTMLIGALGYRAAENANGGQFNGTLKTASELGLLDNVNISNEYLTYEDAEKMLVNACDVKIMVLNDKKYEESSQTLLDKLKIKKSSGLVSGMYGISINGEETANKNIITIDGTAYLKGNSNINQYFGQRVEFYYKSDDENTILYAYSKNDTKIEINAEKITNVTSDKIEYEKGNSIKSIKIRPKFAAINNEEVNLAKNNLKDLLDFENGTVVLTSSENNNIYDIILINKYESGFVTGVFDSSISCYGGLIVDLTNDNDEKIITVFKDGTIINASDINEDDVISVFSSKLYTTIYVSDISFEGTIDSKGSDNTVKIDNTEYKYTYSGNMALGEKGIFYTDIQGKIVYMRLVSGENYAYVIKIMKSEPDYMEIKALSVNDGLKIYAADSNTKVICDDVSQKGAQALEDKLRRGGSFKAQAAKISVNSKGIIARIEFASENVSYDDFSQKNKLVHYGDYDNAYYLNGFFNRFVVGENTKIMKVIKDTAASDTSQAKEFYPVNYLTYDIEVYDVNEQNEPGLIVVVVDDVEEVSIPKLMNNSALAVVRGISVTEDIAFENEKAVKIDVITKGEEKSYLARYGENSIYCVDMNQGLNTTTQKIDTSKLENYISPGDIVEIYTDPDTRTVAGIRRRYDIRRDRNTYTNMSGYYMKANMNRHSTCSFFPYGKVVGISGDKLIIDTTNQYGGTDEHAGRWVFDISSVTYGYRYIRSTNKCDVIGIGDLKIGDSIYIGNSSKNVVAEFVVLD